MSRLANIQNRQTIAIDIPRHGIRIKLFGRVILGEQLHSNHGEYVNDNHKNQRQITQGAYCRNNNAEQHFHCRPRLGQL